MEEETAKEQIPDKAAKYKKILKVIYVIEMLLGTALALFMGFFLGVMATDSPFSTMVHFVLGAAFGFFFFFLPTVLLPYVSIKELENYESGKSLKWNYTLMVINLLFVFLPAGLLQLFFLLRIKRP